MYRIEHDTEKQKNIDVNVGIIKKLAKRKCDITYEC